MTVACPGVARQAASEKTPDPGLREALVDQERPRNVANRLEAGERNQCERDAQPGLASSQHNAQACQELGEPCPDGDGQRPTSMPDCIQPLIAPSSSGGVMLMAQAPIATSCVAAAKA